MQDIVIKSKIKNYYLSFTNDPSFLKRLISNNNFLVVDKKIYNLYKKKLFEKVNPKTLLLLDAHEQTKTIPKVIKIYEDLLRKKVKRNFTLIAVGGGVIQDVVGFVASTLYRGINWIYIPTTLLAQADSCIGAKTSLNFKNFKNIIGTFYPPTEIYIFMDFLKTLSDIDLQNGLGEIIKLQIIGKEKNDLTALSQQIKKARSRNRSALLKLIKTSLLIKKIYIEDDEFDLGKRNLLNYGHTLAHALESTSGYKISHGIAVTVGMIYANVLSKERKMLDTSLFELINSYLLLPNLSSVIFRRDYFDQDNLLLGTKKDKKRTSEGLSFILLSRDFKLIKVNDVSTSEFWHALSVLKSTLKDQIN